MQAQGKETEPSQEELIRDLQHQIHELKNQNLQLQEQMAQKEQFIAMIAHDLRDPLAPIINYAQMLNRYVYPPEERKAPTKANPQPAQRYINIIVSQARRMSRLVNDLQDASRLTSGKFTLERRSCDIVALAMEMVDQLRPLAPYHHLALRTTYRSVKGQWDSGRLQQALGNLLNNAIKYSDEHTVITVTIRATLDRVYVSVHNEGASIPSADMGQLFRPYTRLTTHQKHQGTGLGLYIAKSIVDAHGGTLRLEPHQEQDNDHPRGTTFTFELPLEKELPSQLL